MDSKLKTKGTFENINVNVKIKLAALWTAVMFLYAYADIQHFVLQPGSISEILSGFIGGMEISPAFLFGAALLMTIPTLMIVVSVTFKANLNRWLNIILGTVYTLITVLTWLVPDDTWTYYYFYNVVEVILTALVVWNAWNWPKSN